MYNTNIINCISNIIKAYYAPKYVVVNEKATRNTRYKYELV